MRRVIVEASVEDVGELLGKASPVENVELFETLSILREGPDEIAMVCRVKLKNPTLRFADPTEDVQHLAEESGGAHVYFIKGRPEIPGTRLNPFTTGGYLTTPYEVRDGRVKVSFLGDAQEVKGFLRTLDETGLRYRVVSITDAKFPPSSPLASLTEKQRKVLLTAFSLGYYDIPKKISSAALAKRLHISGPTLVRHRIKAERRVLAALLSES